VMQIPCPLCHQGHSVPRPRLFSAEDKADWRIFFFESLILFQVVQIQIHLACISMSELADLDVNSYHAAQVAVIKQQIQVA